MVMAARRFHSLIWSSPPVFRLSLEQLYTIFPPVLSSVSLLTSRAHANYYLPIFSISILELSFYSAVGKGTGLAPPPKGLLFSSCGIEYGI